MLKNPSYEVGNLIDEGISFDWEKATLSSSIWKIHDERFSFEWEKATLSSSKFS